MHPIARPALAFALALALGGALWFVFGTTDPGAVDAPVTAAESTAGAAVGPDQGDRDEPEPDEPPAPAAVRETAVGAPPPVDLDACDRDLDLHGIVVVDANDTPVAGARVVALSHPGRRVSVLDTREYAREIEVGATRSSVDGTFAMRLARGALVELKVEAEGFATETVAACQAGERVTVRLGPAGVLAVFCRDESGDPVADAAVELWRRDFGTSYGRREARTDEDGKCVFADLRPGEVTVEIQPTVLGSPGWQRVNVLEGDVTTLEVTLPEGQTIEGTVTDAVTGRPIAGARIGENWVLDRAVESDADGRYAFLGWTGNGVPDLHVTAQGYGRVGRRVPESGELDFVLDPGDRARGRILGYEGGAVIGARVTAVASDRKRGESRIDTVSAETGTDGAFTLASLRREMPHTLVVQANGFGRTLLDFDPHPGGAGMIELGDIVLPNGRRIEGRALGPDDAPIVGAAVLLSGQNAGRNRLRPALPPLRFFHGKDEQRRSDDQGRFRFPDLSPGRYELKLRIEGAPEVTRTVDLTADADLLDVTLSGGRGLTLVVEVVDAAGAPIPETRVTLRTRRATDRVTLSTNQEGTATFSGLADDELSISCWRHTSPFLTPPPVTAHATDKRVLVTMHRRAVVSGTVIDTSGAPLASLEVKAIGAGIEDYATTDDDGRFELEVPAGQRVDVVVEGGRRQRTEMKPGTFTQRHEETPYRARADGELAPREELVLIATEVRFDSIIRARVVDPAGHPVAGARVFLDLPPGDVRTADTDTSGRARFEELPPGEAHVWAVGREQRDVLYYESRMVPVSPGDDELVLTLRDGARLEGRVVDHAGRPVEARLRVVEDGIGRMQAFRSHADGRFACVIATDARWFLEGYVRHEEDRIPIPRREVFPGSGELEIRLDEP